MLCVDVCLCVHAHVCTDGHLCARMGIGACMHTPTEEEESKVLHIPAIVSMPADKPTTILRPVRLYILQAQTRGQDLLVP